MGELCFIKTINLWDFPGGPVVKNLPSNAGDAGSIPGQGTKIPHAAGQLSPRAKATELACSQLESPSATNYRAHVLWSPHATSREEKTRTPQLERSPHAAMKDPACPNKDPAYGN